MGLSRARLHRNRRTGFWCALSRRKRGMPTGMDMLVIRTSPSADLTTNLLVPNTDFTYLPSFRPSLRRIAMRSASAMARRQGHPPVGRTT
jgi:hypothetical protein